VAATKSFFHQVLNLIYYATLVAEKKQSADMTLIKEIRQNLLNTPAVAEQSISMAEQSC
jgi:glucosamine 6-phosphate synthetase-like amidotransferase/phosphosugar isomerase protein